MKKKKYHITAISIFGDQYGTMWTKTLNIKVIMNIFLLEQRSSKL